MSSRKIITHLLAAGLLLALLWPAIVRAADQLTVPVAPGDKCPVCGMFVAKYPEFLARVEFKDGSYAVFDGAKDMMKFLQNPGHYLPQKKGLATTRILVTDYYEVKAIDASKAFFVVGSNVYGPMGRELVPFEKEADAREFARDHVAKAVLRFAQIDGATLAGLD